MEEEKTDQRKAIMQKRDDALASLTELEKTGGTALIRAVDLRKLITLAEFLAEADLVPKEFQHKPANVMLALLHAYGLGLDPFRALQNMYVVNGRVAIFGDLVMAVVRAASDCDGIEEWYERKVGEKIVRVDEADINDECLKDATFTAVCAISRNGKVTAKKFSVAMATRAKLIGKAGPWGPYWWKMLLWRARGEDVRIVYPDRLCGIDIYETVLDMESNRVAKATDVTPGRASLRDLVAPPAAEPEQEKEPEAESATAGVELTGKDLFTDREPGQGG